VRRSQERSHLLSVREVGSSLDPADKGVEGPHVPPGQRGDDGRVHTAREPCAHRVGSDAASHSLVQSAPQLKSDPVWISVRQIPTVHLNVAVEPVAGGVPRAGRELVHVLCEGKKGLDLGGEGQRPAPVAPVVQWPHTKGPSGQKQPALAGRCQRTRLGPTPQGFGGGVLYRDAIPCNVLRKGRGRKTRLSIGPGDLYREVGAGDRLHVATPAMPDPLHHRGDLTLSPGLSDASDTRYGDHPPRTRESSSPLLHSPGKRVHGVNTVREGAVVFKHDRKTAIYEALSGTLLQSSATGRTPAWWF